MRILCDALGIISEHDGRFLKYFDANAHGGAGEIRTTAVETEAIEFRDFHAARECYRRISTVQPRRRDGLPNRPLTAYTVEIL